MESGRQKILLVEDDPNFGVVLRDYLAMHDFNVTLCVDGKKGWSRFSNESFDLCILDVMMPELDGFSLGKDIRKVNSLIPLIYLTARNMREDMVKGYGIGADDYVLKPFDPEILLLKIRALLKRTGSNNLNYQDEFGIGNFRFIFSTRELIDGKEHYKLSPREAELLRLLAIHSNQVLPRVVALKSIWGEDNYFTGRSMDVFITRIRKYFKPGSQVEIQNIHGNGYLLKTEV
jgi:DNA-binding response OmpR family regulator